MSLVDGNLVVAARLHRFLGSKTYEFLVHETSFMEIFEVVSNGFLPGR